jgi:hypothetical protein
VKASGKPGGIVVDTSGSEFITVVALYSAGFDELACNFESLADRSRIVWHTDGASEYYILAAALQSVPAGRLKVHFSQADIPSNDLRQGAVAVSPSDAFPIVEPAHTATSDQMTRPSPANHRMARASGFGSRPRPA